MHKIPLHFISSLTHSSLREDEYMPVSSKRLRFIISCLTLSLIFGLALIVPSTLARASLNACPPSLQALIDGTPIGGTLTLPACTFTESVIINKDLTLVGDSSGGTILQAPLNQPVYHRWKRRRFWWGCNIYPRRHYLVWQPANFRQLHL
jgi:hypothetical protein